MRLPLTALADRTTMSDPERAAEDIANHKLSPPTRGVSEAPPPPGGTMSTVLLASRTTDGGPSGLTVPGKLGRYKLLKVLGRGGMGTVYKAHDTQLDQDVALKIPHFSGHDAPSHLERFYTEARTARRLRHPNICAVYDVNEIDGIHHLSMAYVE